MIGPALDTFPALSSDASIIRFLKARNWNTNKAARMLKEAMKWRMQYKPEKIRWNDIATEAVTGKLYRANFYDKHGRTVLVMRPGLKNTSSTELQIKYLVYCLENAILGLKAGQEQMVWLIDFQSWNMSSISVNVTRETAHILQNCYPERLALGILFNPPKIFESFWLMVKPFLEKKTYRKVKFVYSDKPESKKVMDYLFDMEMLESCFGGRNTGGFNYDDYAKCMIEEDKKMDEFIKSGCPLPSDLAVNPESNQSKALISETCSEASYEELPPHGEDGDSESPECCNYATEHTG